MLTMSCAGNLVWDVNKRLIGYSEPNAIRSNYLGKNTTSLFTANENAGGTTEIISGLVSAQNFSAGCARGAGSSGLPVRPGT